jgi:hypothetical protein
VRLNCQHRDVPLGRDDFQIRLRHRFVAFASPRSAVRDKALTSEHNSFITGFTDNPPGVKIRYKLVQQSGQEHDNSNTFGRPAALSFVAARPDRSVFITSLQAESVGIYLCFLWSRTKTDN